MTILLDLLVGGWRMEKKRESRRISRGLIQRNQIMVVPFIELRENRGKASLVGIGGNQEFCLGHGQVEVNHKFSSYSEIRFQINFIHKTVLIRNIKCPNPHYSSNSEFTIKCSSIPQYRPGSTYSFT